MSEPLSRNNKNQERAIEHERHLPGASITESIRLTKDLKASAKLLTPGQARYMVDLYYTIQNYRIRSANQVRATDASKEPNALIDWMLGTQHTLENDIRKAMDLYSSESEVGRWSKSVLGIGPIIAAGLLAHIDIEKAPHAGHIWSFAGLVPSKTWDKGEKRPWNARLKVLCWKIGESFVKVHNKPSAFYGHLYDERKQLEEKRNEKGEFAEQAAAKLEAVRIGKTTEAYKWYSQGKLPPGHRHARAKRWAVKIFLSHWHRVAYRAEFKRDPEPPWIIAHGGHSDLLQVPEWPF